MFEFVISFSMMKVLPLCHSELTKSIPEHISEHISIIFEDNIFVDQTDYEYNSKLQLHSEDQD